MDDAPAARFIIVQHAEKQPIPGDPGLTVLGCRQADRVARHLNGTTFVGLYASPLRRARETAAAIALAVGIDLRVDHRLTERINWPGPPQQTAEEFLDQWARSVADRSYVPTTGDSSLAAAARFERFLEEVDRRHPEGVIGVVSHGGVTTDLLRTLLGDEHLRSAAPDLFEHGMPSCGQTTLSGGGGAWQVRGIGVLAA